MQEHHASHAAEQLRRFFAQVEELSRAQAEALWRVQRSRTTSPLAFSVHPDRLAGVSSGQWTPAHDALVAQARRAACRSAARLAPYGRRRALSVVLEGAAIAVVANSLPEPVLSAALREHLSRPWTTIVGPLPGAPFAELHVAAAQ